MYCYMNFSFSQILHLDFLGLLHTHHFFTSTLQHHYSLGCADLSFYVKLGMLLSTPMTLKLHLWGLVWFELPLGVKTTLSELFPSFQFLMPSGIPLSAQFLSLKSSYLNWMLLGSPAEEAFTCDWCYRFPPTKQAPDQPNAVYRWPSVCLSPYKNDNWFQSIHVPYIHS